MHAVQPDTLLVVRLEDYPGGVRGVGIEEHGFLGSGVIISLVDRGLIDS